MSDYAEVERDLRARVAELERERDEARVYVESNKHAAETAAGEREQMRTRAERAEKERDEARAEAERLHVEQVVFAIKDGIGSVVRERERADRAETAAAAMRAALVDAEEYFRDFDEDAQKVSCEDCQAVRPAPHDAECCFAVLAQSDAGRVLLERMERYEKALKEIGKQRVHEQSMGRSFCEWCDGDERHRNGCPTLVARAALDGEGRDGR